MKNVFLLLAVLSASLGYSQVTDTGEIPFVNNTYTGNVGVNIDDPAATLHVNGNEILGKALPADADKQYSPLVRDTQTGEIRILPADSSSETPKPFNYVTYNISNPDGDWILDLNLRIPKDKYYVSVNGSQFLNGQSRTGDIGFLYVARNSVKQQSFEGSNGQDITIDDPVVNGPYDVFASKNVRTFTNNSDNYWHLKADYAGAGPVNGVDGTWVIELLVIDRAYVKSVSPISVDMNSNAIGSVSSTQVPNL